MSRKKLPGNQARPARTGVPGEPASPDAAAPDDVRGAGADASPASIDPGPASSPVPPTASAAPAALPSGVLLAARGLCLDFGGVKALDLVDLDLAPGECLAVIGPNGAGKTTLFNVLSGFADPERGEVWLKGRNLAGMGPSDRAGLGMVRTFQNGRTFPALSARQNLLLGAHHLRTRGRKGLGLLGHEALDALFPRRRKQQDQDLKDQVESIASFFGDRLLPRLDEGAWTFSYANRRRLEIGRALAARPEVLLLDEPTAGMNPAETRGLLDFLQSLKLRGQTMLIIEHKLPLVMELADRVLVMDEGRVIARGSPAEVAIDPAVVEAWLGKSREVSDPGEAGQETTREAGQDRGSVSQEGGETGTSIGGSAVPGSTPPGVLPATGLLMHAPSVPLLSLLGVHAGYGGMEVLHGLDLKVGEGEIVCLLGGNASGKSTTMKTILGLVKPVSGGLFWEGRSLEGVATPERIALGMASVPEASRLFADLSVRENLLMGAWVHRGHRHAATRKADLERVLDLFPRLADRLGQAGGSLSGGEQQMLAMARALMSRPRLMLLDEPTMGLAPAWVDRILQVIVDLHARGTAIFMVEQNAHQALGIAGRAYVLQNGILVMEGKARDIAADEGIRRAYLGDLA